METRSKSSNKKVANNKNFEESVVNYDDYNNLKKSLEKLRHQEAEIERLIDLNTKEIRNFRSLYFKNTQNFNKCKGEYCNRQLCSVLCEDIGRYTSYVSQCKDCKSFYLRELCSDSYGENYTYRDV